MGRTRDLTNRKCTKNPKLLLFRGGKKIMKEKGGNPRMKNHPIDQKRGKKKKKKIRHNKEEEGNKITRETH